MVKLRIIELKGNDAVPEHANAGINLALHALGDNGVIGKGKE